jgi:hypothetical protein
VARACARAARLCTAHTPPSHNRRIHADRERARPLPRQDRVSTSILDTRLQPSTTVRASITHDGLVLLDVDGGLVLTANVVGARIWQLIEEQLRTSDIASRIAAEYEITHERAATDVAAFVASLAARGLLAGPSPS